MRRYIILLLFCTASVHAYNQEKIYTIMPGQKMTDVVPDSVQYFTKNFIKGTALLKDGRRGGMILNYNHLFEEIMFVDDKKDTVSLQNPEDFVFFVINKDTFFYSNKVYLRKLASFGDTFLAERTFFITTNIKRPGAMGTTSSGVAVDMVRQTESEVGLRSLVFSEQVDLKLKHDYYIGDTKNDFKLATKKSLQKYAPNKARLKEYLKTNDVNFLNKEDIMKVLAFVQ